MKNRRRFVALATVFGAVLALAAEPEPHVLMISVDGMMATTYTSPGPARIPVLRDLVAKGAWAEGVVSVLPSVTYPAHTTLMTGRQSRRAWHSRQPDVR